MFKHNKSIWLIIQIILILELSSVLPNKLFAEVQIVEKDSVVSFENQFIKVNYDLSKGSYQIIDNKMNQVCISDAVYHIADIYGEVCSTDVGYFHNWNSEIIEDEIGKGKKLTITSSKLKVPDLILEISLYDGKSFIVLNAGVDNNTGYHIYLRRINPIKSNAFNGFDLENNWAMLDGNSGGVETRVRRDDHLKCWNNLLITFGDGKFRRSLVIGGLTYNEFEKWAEVKKNNNSIEMDLWSDDPWGKRIETNTIYLPNEKYYIDFMTPNPFEALEKYSLTLRKAQKINLGYYDFPTLCLWYSGMEIFGDGHKNNDSPGAVWEMEQAAKSGFLKYSQVAIRLVPDNYQKDNQQGWWDDVHWQMHPNKAASIGPCYKPPYETTEKWGQAVTKLGGIPLMYSQTARRSEDYCRQHPDHVLFNDPDRFTNTQQWWHDEYKYPAKVRYDFTDPGFIQHTKEVYANLRKGGIRGLMYDYPLTGWMEEGGFEDKYATTAYAYRNIYKLAYDGLVTPGYLHERNLARGSDITLGLVASQRSQGDSDRLTPKMLHKPALRWYKNRVVVNYDTDAKNPFQVLPDNRDGVRTMFTMCYVATGRILLGTSFSKMNKKQLYDLSRVYPFHASPKSARPIDMFLHDGCPRIYDFEINSKWHQLVLYNNTWDGEFPDFQWRTIKKVDKEIKEGKYGSYIGDKLSVDLSADNVIGGLEFDSEKKYYIYDFWNDHFVGKFKGSDRLEQTLRAGEARVMSIHEVEPNPQFLSTNRHIMQGFVDMAKYPEWDNSKNELIGISKVIGGETYKVVIATNGFSPVNSTAKKAQTNLLISDQENGLIELSLDCSENALVEWVIKFEK